MKKYKDIRYKINTGDLILFQGSGLISGLIRLLTWSKISHVGIAYQWCDDMFIWESIVGLNGDGVQISLLSQKIKKYRGKIWIRRLACNRNSRFYRIISDFREYTKHKKYERSILELLGSIMPWRNKPNSMYYFCSELIADLYQKWGLMNEKPPNEYTPSDFFILKKLNNAALSLPERIK
jgi:hypothetical protein